MENVIQIAIEQTVKIPVGIEQPADIYSERHSNTRRYDQYSLPTSNEDHFHLSQSVDESRSQYPLGCSGLHTLHSTPLTEYSSNNGTHSQCNFPLGKQSILEDSDDSLRDRDYTQLIQVRK